jgi:hypothetical protein
MAMGASMSASARSGGVSGIHAGHPQPASISACARARSSRCCELRVCHFIGCRHCRGSCLFYPARARLPDQPGPSNEEFLSAMPCRCRCAATRILILNSSSVRRSSGVHACTRALLPHSSPLPMQPFILAPGACARMGSDWQSATVGPAAAPSLSWSPYANGGCARQGTAQNVSVACRPWTRCAAPPTGGQMRACASLPW